MNLKSIKEMRKIIKLLVIISFVLVGVLSFSIYTQITGEAVKDYYTYTKAICDENNFCQDYEIVCEGEKFIEMNPIIGASVQNPDEWQDPRDESEQNMNSLCNISE